MGAPEKDRWSSDDYVSEATLEERTEISRRQWQRWRTKGNGPPCVILGRRLVRYRWGDVVDWLMQSGQASGGGSG